MFGDAEIVPIGSIKASIPNNLVKRPLFIPSYKTPAIRKAIISGHATLRPDSSLHLHESPDILECNYIGRISSKLLVVFVTTYNVLPVDPPNFVVYLADDYGYGSLNAYGVNPGLVRTPNLNRLAAEGVRFNRGFTTGSVCYPTR